MGKSWLDNRNAVKQAEVQARIARSQALVAGWLDDFIGFIAFCPFLYILALPLIIVWDPAISYEQAVDHMILKFKLMFANDGSYYHWVLAAIISAVFGVKVHRGHIARKVLNGNGNGNGMNGHANGESATTGVTTPPVDDNRRK